MCNVSVVFPRGWERETRLDGEGSFTKATKGKQKCNVNLYAKKGHLIKIMSYIKTCHPCYAPGVYGDRRSTIESHFMALSSTSLMT